MQQNKSIDDIAKLLNGKASEKGLFVYRINSLKNASDGDISFYTDNKLKSKIQALQADEKKYQKEALTLADDQKDQTEKSLQQRRIEIQRLERELREDMDLRRREEIGDLQEKINQSIDKIAADEKYDLILYNGIAFASENVDITRRIIKSLGGSDSKTEDKKGSKEAPKSKKDAAE